MSAQGPETSEEKIQTLLGRIEDAQREFVISSNNYNKLTNPRLKNVVEERMNLLLISIMKYAVEGMPKEYIRPYPDWIRNNQQIIQELLNTPGISASTAREVNELNAQIMNPGAAPQPQAHRAPDPDPFRPQQQAYERARREAQEERARREAQEEREKQEHEESPEVIAERKRAYDSVINDPEAILKVYKSILGISRLQAKLSAKGKESRNEIENIVKLFSLFRNSPEGEWHENAKAAYCYVKAIYDKYDVRFYGKGYEKKQQDPVAEACFGLLEPLARAVSSDYNNIHNQFTGGAAKDYVRRCDDKLRNADNEKRNRPNR